MPTPKPHTAAVPANDTAVIRLRAVSRTLLADLQTPVGIYLKVRDIFPESALLESSDYHSSENSFSHIGIEPIARLVVEGDTVTEQYPDRTVRTYPLTDDISLPDALNAFVRRFAVESDRPTTNGLFGYTSYDAVRHFEQVRIESRPPPEAEVPEMVYLLYRFVISVNHLRTEMTITENLAEGETSRMDTLLGILASRNFPTYGFRTTGPVTSPITEYVQFPSSLIPTTGISSSGWPPYTTSSVPSLNEKV